jgi:hypothetical protein
VVAILDGVDEVGVADSNAVVGITTAAVDITTAAVTMNGTRAEIAVAAVASISIRAEIGAGIAVETIISRCGEVGNVE